MADQPPQPSLYTRYLLLRGFGGTPCEPRQLAERVELQRLRSHHRVWRDLASSNTASGSTVLVEEADAVTAQQRSNVVEEHHDADVVLVDGWGYGGRLARPGTLAYLLVDAPRVAQALMALTEPVATQPVDMLLDVAGRLGRLRVVDARPTSSGSLVVSTATAFRRRPLRQWRGMAADVWHGGYQHWMPDVGLWVVVVGIVLLVVCWCAVRWRRSRRS